MKKAGQDAWYFSSRESGINSIIPKLIKNSQIASFNELEEAPYTL
jgi:hypothetical protein